MHTAGWQVRRRGPASYGGSTGASSGSREPAGSQRVTYKVDKAVLGLETVYVGGSGPAEVSPPRIETIVEIR